MLVIRTQRTFRTQRRAGAHLSRRDHADVPRVRGGVNAECEESGPVVCIPNGIVQLNNFSI